MLHSRYPVVPGRFKDYISTPKPNGYRSLHTGLIGPERQRIEVQIRTREMHEVAEFGVAAHWKYKQDAHKVDGRQYRWLRELLDILEHASNPEEFLEHTKLEMFQDQVFCFTPKGDLIALPSGATPVDFAYAVHSEVGDTCVGAKVNGRMVPLRTRLKNGDQVEIITSRAQTPRPTGKPSSSPARPSLGSAASSASSSASNTANWAARCCRRPSARRVTSSRESDRLGAQEVPLRGRGGPLCGVGQGHLTAREVLVAVFPGVKESQEGRHRRADRSGAPWQGQDQGQRGADQGPDPRHGRALRPLLPSPAGRPHRRHRHHRQGRDGAHHRLRDPGSFQDTPERWVDMAWDVNDEGEHLLGRLARGGGQRAGQSGFTLDHHRQEPGQHQQPEDHQPLGRLSSRC